MNKLFKLIYVNLLGLFDINKIIIAREDGVKSNLEKRTILVVLMNLVYTYFFYVILSKITLEDKTLILVMGFFISTILCFSSDLSTVESLIFKSDDIDFLFSYPVTKNQILFSKLFTIYLKNLLTVALFMIVCILSYYNSGGVINETLFIMILVVSLTIPIIPIVLATIISYVDDYYKTKTHNSILYKVIRIIILAVVFGLLILLFKGIKVDNLDNMFLTFLDRANYVYPINIIFHSMLFNESVLLFIVMIVIPILCCYLYTFVISNNYLKICSLLKGVKKEKEFNLKKSSNLGKILGMFRKEVISLFKNKVYLKTSFSFSLLFTIILIVVCNVIDIDELNNINNMNIYVSLYLPMILSFMGSSGCSTISSMSLEKDNMQMLRTMPISIGKVLFGKWLVNIVIGIIFVIINGTVVMVFLDIDKWTIMFSFLLPFLSLLLVSLTGLILDYRFIEKNETEDNVIVKQRIITMVPIFMSLCIGIGPFFLPIYNEYRYLLGAFILVFVIMMIIEWLYLLINRKKLISNLFK